MSSGFVVILLFFVLLVLFLVENLFRSDSGGDGVTCCPRCGGRDISFLPPVQGFGAYSPPVNVKCRGCGWTGPPIIINSEMEYEKFAKDVGQDEDRFRRMKSQRDWGVMFNAEEDE